MISTGGCIQGAEKAASARELVRKHNISEQSVYRWKNKYGGILAEVQRLKEAVRRRILIATTVLAVVRECIDRISMQLESICRYMNELRSKSGLP